MRIRLFWKFIIVYAVVAVISFVLISTLGSRFFENGIINRKSLDLYNEAMVISDDINTRKDTLPSLYDKLRSIAAYQATTIWLLSNDGTILLDTSVPYADEPVAKVENFDRVALGTGYYFTGTFFDYFPENMLSIIVPVSPGLTPSGYLVIHLRMSVIAEFREAMLATVHLVSIIVFLIYLVILLFIALWIIFPLRKIAAGAREFASGNLKHSIGLKSGDEMEYLSETLDYMASELDKSNDYQRTFIANVSHDFRSPLTSIKGYAQAMQDGTIPPELQPKYLSIIISEADRLNKLSQEMLAIQKAGSGRILDMKVFDINGMIKDTAASFEGTCITKNIMIDLVMEEESLNVYADFSQIQQVLYNLTDNAIKFSRNNSTIEIETSIRYNKAYIVVRDHGIGIASSELPKIWDRFYKADTSRGKDPRGSGLGLAIVKEIIQAHGQKINVVSTPDVGTEFSFSLELADD